MGLFNRSKKITKPPQSEVNSVAPSHCPQPGHHHQQQQQYNAHHVQGGQSHLGFAPKFGFQPGSKARQQQQQPHQQQHHQSQQHHHTYPPQYHHQPQPIVVNQYYISPQPSHQAVIMNPQNSMQLVHRPQTAAPYFQAAPPSTSNLSKINQSVANAAHSVVPSDKTINSTWHDLTDINAITEDWHPHATLLLNQTAACADILATGFDKLMTSIDRENYKGHEGELFNFGQPSSAKPSYESDNHTSSKPKRRKKPAYKGDTTASLASSSPSTSIISKVELYANSRLPRDLPPLRLYMPTWPILCLAAQYAERVYNPPSGAERHAHVASNWRTGTKAMVIKSVPMDHMSAIVFAIRGTATFADWAVNLNAAPAAPRGFLDDQSNLCHAGFLSVARSMVPAVASRLRQLLREDPSRAAYSLIITGHSAGGAVASLLYCHMLAEQTGKAASELTAVAGAFKRVHCVVFGTPPVSLRPLQKPDRPELMKSLFLSFINEGDPVARADKAYVRSLLELFASPAPRKPASAESEKDRERRKREKRDQPRELRFEREKGRKGSEVLALPAPESSGAKEKKPVVRFAETPGKSTSDEEREKKDRKERKKRKGPIWKVPASSLSSPGRIVVLRSGSRYTHGARRTVEDRLNEGVIAQTATDEDLRGLVWGDPVCHVMRLYAGRIETLAVGAVTGKIGR